MDGSATFVWECIATVFRRPNYRGTANEVRACIELYDEMYNAAEGRRVRVLQSGNGRHTGHALRQLASSSLAD